MTPPPSLRQRLLTILLLPLTLAWIGSGVLIYVLALHYANVNYDRSLADTAHSLERIASSEAGADGLSPQVRMLLESETADPTWYSVRSVEHGVLAANLDMPLPAQTPVVGAPPRLDSVTVGNRSLRMASLALRDGNSGDTIVISSAETLNARHALAREILIGTLPVVLILIGIVLALVWVGVSRGLRLLDPLVEQLAQRRARDLEPLDQSNVPTEIRPLTQTIDALLQRVRGLLEVQERFIADAAHQLRTPLAGLRLQAERALADPRPDSVREALSHVERLSAGAGRAAGQLLALARAQAEAHDNFARVDLARLARDLAAERVPEALRMGIDLGYEGPATNADSYGDAVMLREALVNLVDNALNYAGERGRVTISVRQELRTLVLEVEDSGPGVPEAWWPRLGERFFRPPESRREGSGLGLAIVRRIIERHGGAVSFAHGRSGTGLRVTLRLPAA
ncbi:MAG: sensor histidine kinase N-terminal domain-containing protein [Dokdonella sp.]|uniref:sensor histidine kinase n=1 Tax=Dokdonella sp. TaxID=2291710 RepID=UPI0025BB798A|nr:sensor histidine kinase [Dokdonella sp.]MBZ0222751.1 sensor histidine kinase N-terminal domain-containing protein [Dokdonella sp.]MCC7255274.1 sensor histidine kinase N-terminal domain-containing protein [Dokdonella sp.]